MSEAYPVFLAGQRITAALLSSAQPQVIRKTADTSRTSTTTTTADPHLQISLLSNAVYVWSGWVKYDTDAAADLVLDFTLPGDALGEWLGFGAGNPVTGASATPTLRVDTQGVSGYMIRTETNDVAQSRSFGGLGVGITMGVMMNGIVRMGPTAGTLSLDWAQSASSATATTLYTDSWMLFQRIA